MFKFYAGPTTECLAKAGNIAQIIFSGVFMIVISFYTHIRRRYVHIILWCTMYELSVYEFNSCVQLHSR